MKKYFVSSDIHSFYDEWLDGLHKAGFDLQDPNHILLICGDLFDRGDKTLECYNLIKDMYAQNRLIYIRGNHEDLLARCVCDIKLSNRIESHHKSNGTLKTLSHFMNCTVYDILCGCYDKNEFNNITTDLLDFIDSVTKDYYQIGDKVFVHGWVPLTTDTEGNLIVHENWREGDWVEARWECCFDNYLNNLVPPQGETVVCGHWHTSYGWHLFKGLSEWGIDAKFTPFIGSNMIAIDGCTAFTRHVNVVVFDEQGNLLSTEDRKEEIL